MPKPLVTDELWAVVEPLLPEEPPKPNGGRPRVDDRAALKGILFVLETGIPWGMLPQEMGCGSGTTRWRRLKEWPRSRGVGALAQDPAGPPGGGRPHRLGEGFFGLGGGGRPRGGQKTGKNPTDRGEQGSKRHLLWSTEAAPRLR